MYPAPLVVKAVAPIEPTEFNVTVLRGPFPALSVALVQADGATLHVYALIAVLFHRYASTRVIGTVATAAVELPHAFGTAQTDVVYVDPHPRPLVTS
jgi:hypothetical protein